MDSSSATSFPVRTTHRGLCTSPPSTHGSLTGRLLDFYHRTQTPPNPTMINLNPHTSFKYSYLGEVLCEAGGGVGRSFAISFPSPNGQLPNPSRNKPTDFCNHREPRSVFQHLVIPKALKRQSVTPSHSKPSPVSHLLPVVHHGCLHPIQ